MVYQFAHLPNQVPDLPLRPSAERFICHMDQFPQIARQIQRCGTGIGEKIPGILVWNAMCLTSLIPGLDAIHSQVHILIGDGRRGHIPESIF
jgi:hypothetical protein